MSTQAIRSRENPNLELIAFHGHFATRHSHNSHYLDITRLKHEYSLAHDTALALANHYIYEKSIDTIICMDGSEVIGAFLGPERRNVGAVFPDERHEQLRRDPRPVFGGAGGGL